MRIVVGCSVSSVDVEFFYESFEICSPCTFILYLRKLALLCQNQKYVGSFNNGQNEKKWLQYIVK